MLRCVLAEPRLTNVASSLPEEATGRRTRNSPAPYGHASNRDETHTICAGPAAARTSGNSIPIFVVFGKPIAAASPGPPMAAAKKSPAHLRRIQLEIAT